MSAIEPLDAIPALEPVLDIFVPGIMMAQGSKNPFGGESGNDRRTDKNGNETQPANRLRDWRRLVSGVAREAWGGRAPLDEPVAVRYEFVKDRGSHPKWRYWAHTKPDVEKLTRGISDSLARPSKPPGPRMKEWVGASVLYDDSRVVCPYTPKRLARPGEEPGVHIQVYALGALERAGFVLDAPFMLTAKPAA